MTEFYTVDIPIPPSLERLFKSVRLCSNGSIVVSYKVPVDVDGVNIGDETIVEFAHAVVTPGAMVTLDVCPLDLEGVFRS